MRKFGIAALVVFAVFVSAACESKSDKPATTVGPTYVVPAPTTTTTVEDHSAEIAKCASDFQTYSEALTELGAIAPQITTIAEARAFIAAGREAVAAGHRGIAQCGKYVPASTVAEFAASLDQLDAALDQADALVS